MGTFKYEANQESDMIDPNEPISPRHYEAFEREGTTHINTEGGNLTVRQMFIKDIFCALLANSSLSTVSGYLNTDIQRARAIVEADALIAALNKEPT